jgi:uncharacterized protein with PIN domain
MACTHDGFHGIHTAYDHRRGLLRFFWRCELCGARLRELHREEYRPRFDPRGNERYATSVH